MARVTVEDCLENVENRFRLVLLASKRARQLSLGSEPMVERENDKPTVLALREIEDGLIDETSIQATADSLIEGQSGFDADEFAAALHAQISSELSQQVPPQSATSTMTELQENVSPGTAFSVVPEPRNPLFPNAPGSSDDSIITSSSSEKDT